MTDIDKTEWGELRQTVRTIAEHTGEIRVTLKEQNGRIDRVEREFEPIKQADLPRRMGKMENWRSYLAGGIAVLGIIIAIILKVVL